MPIEVYQIENLFWHPGSYRQPNALPTLFKDQKVFNKIPQIYDMHTGSVTLTGDHWNWCKYKDIYYILKRGTPLDIRRKRYLYHMIRDPWANTVLSGRIVVKGDLSTWNIDKDLEQHLNRTVPIIEKPAAIARVQFENITNDWKNKLSYIPDNEQSTIKIAEKEILCPVLGYRHSSWLNSRAELVRAYKWASEHLHIARKDIYILGTFYPSYLKDNWKNEVRKICNTALEEMLNDEERIIGKVAASAFKTNKLAGHYCITYKDQSIGQQDNTVEVTSIDLSGLTDIRRISPVTLEEVTPDVPLNESTAFFDTESGGGFNEELANRVYKLCRRIYLPLNKPRIFGTRNSKEYPTRRWRINDTSAQKVSIKVNDYSSETDSYFYWVDKIDFQLSYATGADGYYNWRQYVGGSLIVAGTIIGSALSLGAVGVGVGVGAATWAAAGVAGTIQAASGAGIATTIIYAVQDKEGYWEDQNSTFYKLCWKQEKSDLFYKYSWLSYWTWGGGNNWHLHTIHRFLPYFPRGIKQTNENSIWQKFGRRTPPYGILLWQMHKRWGDWERCVYTGKKTLTEIPVYCGIKRSEFLKRFKDRNNEWWSNIWSPLYFLCNQEYISKFFLDYFQLNFLNFLPLREENHLTESTQHKCDTTDDWYISRHLYGSRDCELTRFLDRQEFIRPDGSRVENPWRLERYHGFWKPRERDLLNFMTTDVMKLEQPLEDGDFLISDLEYCWREYNTNSWKNYNDEVTSLVKQDDWTKYTMNLLEDFYDDGWGYKTDEHFIFNRYGNTTEWANDIEKKLYICTDLNGRVGVKQAYHYGVSHKLCTDPDQMVTAVDGSQSRWTNYWHFKGTDVELFENDININRKLAAAFYKQLGYSVRISDNLAYWDFLSINEVKNSYHGNLFDLVGTKWYVFIRKKEVHFIIKNPKDTVIQPLVKTSLGFLKPEKTDDPSKKSQFQILNELSLTQKVNQVCTLYHKTYSAPLMSKFLFTYEKDPVEPEVVITAPNTGLTIKTSDPAIISFKNAFDRIDEGTTLPLEVTNIQNIGDRFLYDKARLEQLRAQEDYELRRSELGLGMRVADSTARRAQWDLDYKAYTSKVNMAFSALNIVGAAWRKAGPGLINQGINSMFNTMYRAQMGLTPRDYRNDIGTDEIFRPYASHSVNDWENMMAGYEAGYSTKTLGSTAHFGVGAVSAHAMKNRMLTTAKPIMKGISSMERFLGMGGKDHTGIFGNVQSIVNDANFINYVHPEMSRRVEEDKRFATEELRNQYLANDYTHFRRKQDAALQIQSLVHVWDREVPTDMYLQSKLEELRGVKETYILVRYPSEEQAKYLEEYRCEFGIDCDIPNQVIVLTNGMTENIMCFRNIDDEGIVGVNNEFDREWLREKLLAGVKIVDAEQIKLPYDFFDHNLIVPSIIRDDESLLTKVRELEEQLEQCKRENKFKGEYWVKNFDQALKRIKEDVENPDKLKEDIEEVKREIGFAEQNPENYSEEVLTLYKDLLEALETEYKQVLKSIKTRKDLEDTIKRADDAENERDDLREQLNKAHEKTRELLETKDQLEKEKNQCNASLSRCLSKQNHYSQYITHLQELIDNWVKFAETLGIKTTKTKLDPETPGTSIQDLKSLQEQLQEKEKQLDLQRRKIAEELDASKKKVLVLEGKVQKCASDSALGLIQASKHVRGWSICDFLKAFKEMNWDFNTMYTLLSKTSCYGFTWPEMYISSRFTNLQASQQIIEECEDLLANNTSFMWSDNNAFREYLLTEQGAEKLRELKRHFIVQWADQWNYRATLYERSKLREFSDNVKSSKYYKEKIGLYSFYYTTSPSVNIADNEYAWYEPSPDAAKNYKSSFWDASLSYDTSIRGICQFVIGRCNYKNPRNYTDFNYEIYNSWAYYDFHKKEPNFMLPLWSIVYYFLTGYHIPSPELLDYLGKRSFSSNVVDRRPSGAPRNYMYTGFSNRKFSIGYLIRFLRFAQAYWRSLGDSATIWNLSYMSPHNKQHMITWMNYTGIYNKRNWEYVIYSWKILYYVICENKSWEEAQQIVEDELDPPKPPAVPEEESDGEEPMETEDEARMREMKLKEVYPGGE